MSDLAVLQAGFEALDALSDTSLTIEDRAAVYATWHQIQLRINRKLKAVKDELIIYMEREGLRELGPLSVASTAIDVEWPCNAPGNWQDSTIQDALRGLYEAPATNDYIRSIPAHYEIDTAALGADVHAGIPAARQLHDQLKEHGWRTEAGKRLSLRVREAKREKEAA